MGGFMTHDVFISYEHTAKSIADNIAAILENEKIRCWYAPRDVIGDYATSIVNAIENSKIFIAVVSGVSSESVQVLNEIEIAYKKLSENSISIIPFKVDNKQLSRAMEYYIKRLHWIDAVNSTLEIAIADLCKKVKSILGINEVSENKKTKRAKSDYFVGIDETNRLGLQLQLLKKFDFDVYANMKNEYEYLNVLDLGSGTGKEIISKFECSPNLKSLVGIELDPSLVKKANDIYGSNSIRFFSYDVEDESFDNCLNTIINDMNIDSFNIINISMLLLHLKNPHKLLVKIRKFLSTDGKVVIRDIDDGLNIAFPDDDCDFDRIYDICAKNKTSGVRKNGRQIPIHLMRSGYQNITLVKSGLNTLNMSYDERELLFNIYIRLVFRDIIWMYQQYPNDEAIANDFHWFEDKYEDILEKFLSTEFFFSLGFMTFIATK
jgi:SAM-dependent methyltransferase